jgi:hypothetical protein
MRWSRDFAKLLQSLQTVIKTTKCQSSLSAPSRCSSRYPYAGALQWWYYTIVNLNMAVQPSSIGSSTTMGEVWHHDAYQKILTSDVMHLNWYFIFSLISAVSVALERAGSIPLFSLYILSKFLSQFELSYYYIHCCVLFYLVVLGCQVQSFWSFITLLCTSDIWLTGCHLVSSWCHI